MPEPIENAYFNWLCAKVLGLGDRNYIDLLRILHTTEFVWVLSGDRDRAADGLELRAEFTNASRSSPDPLLFDVGCSIFEMLFAFAKRAEFQTDIKASTWFWIFINNLELNEYRRITRHDVPNIESILYSFIWREYDDNGRGGLFPLTYPRHDQRTVEIWYQFYEYLDEQDPI